MEKFTIRLKVYIRIQVHEYAWFDVSSCVRQGDSFSPTLFSIPVSVNDLEREIGDLGLGFDVGSGL